MSKFVVWHADFSVGNVSLDEQHKGLFELVNEVWNSRKDCDKKKRQLFKKVLDARRKHCEDEERILARNGYPGLEEHRHEHRKLVKQIQKVLDSCDHDAKKSWYDMMTFLMHELLSRHLVGADMACRDYLRSLPPAAHAIVKVP
ncbi:MAG: hemerythrin domain-containing protein [Sulfuricella sp.]|nr:hemerythrin domain-containing protein [Sulfuricella sp.]